MWAKLEELDHQSLSSQLLSFLSFALRCRPAGAPGQPRPQQITHFYTITSRSLPAHGWVQVSPVCLPLCANFRPIIRCNKCAMGRVTFTLIVCTQRGSLLPHHGSKVSSIVSDFLFPFLAFLCCFFSLSQPGPNYTGSSWLQIGHCCDWQAWGDALWPCWSLWASRQVICGARKRWAKMRKVKAHALHIMCPHRNLDSIVVLSAEVSKFDKMPRHLSPAQLPQMVNDRGWAAEITVTLILPK